MDGWMDVCLATVCPFQQQYQNDGQVITKGCLQWETLQTALKTVKYGFTIISFYNQYDQYANIP